MAEYKKGGLTGNSNLYATNRLFVKNPLFKKRKKKAPGVYSPTAKFRYKEGGVSKDPSIATLNQMAKGGEPGVYILDGYKYKKDSSGKWSYESGQPIDDGLLIAKLDQQAKPVGTPAITLAPKPKPTLIQKKTEYANLINSPLIANQEKAQKLGKEISKESQQKDLYEPDPSNIIHTGKGFEATLNSALDYPMTKASIAASASGEDGSNEIDNLRHPLAGRYAAEAVMDYFPEWMQYTGIPQAAGFLGANVMGIGHEADVIFKDDRPWSTKLRESGEDIFNNAVGAGVGILPMSSKDKTNTLLELSTKNMLPDGMDAPPYNIPGFNTEHNMYFKKDRNDPGKFMSPYRQKKGGAIQDLSKEEIQKYIDGGYIVEEVNDPSIPKLGGFAKGGAQGCPQGTYWNGTKCTKLITLKNDKKYIDGVANWAMHVSDPNKITSAYNDSIKERLYGGKWGLDPESGALVKLSAVQPKSVTTLDAKTKADREREKKEQEAQRIRWESQDTYRQSIIDAGFDPATFGKAKGVNTITGEPIYASSKEEAERINQEAINQFAIEGHAAVVNNPVFQAASYFTPWGMAIGAMRGAARLVPDTYNFAKDPSWSGAGQIVMDIAETTPFAKPIASAVKTGIKNVPYIAKGTKLNPWEKDYGYRMLGSKIGFDDAIDSGVLRPRQTKAQTTGGIEIGGDGTGIQPYTLFGKEKPISNYGRWGHTGTSENPFMARVPQNNLNFKPKDNPADWNVIRAKSIPITDPGVQMFQEKWWGWKPMYNSPNKAILSELPGSPNASISGTLTQVKPKASADSVDTFKSDIDWSNWNKEIPENAPLMQEYTAIEKSSKANGTWMKNADGTPFNGTPEQFVQQQSQNFKKAYPKGTTTTYRGDATHTPTLTNKNSVGNSVFTGEENLAQHYTGNTDYYNSNIFSTENKIIPKDQWDSYSEAMKNSTLSKYGDKLKIVDNASDPGLTPAGMHKLYVKNSDNQVIIDAKNADWHSIENPFPENIRIDKQLGERTKDYAKQGDYVNTDQIARVLEEQGIDKAIINNIQDGKLGNIIINNQNPGNYLKSMMGNNGMFDLSNPNIYKAIIPTVGVTGLTGLMLANPFQGSSGLPQQKKGGSTTDAIEIDIPEEEIQWYIDNGYIVEPVTKLKKFIG